MRRLRINSLGLPTQCPEHKHYSHLPCAWPHCSHSIDADSLIAEFENGVRSGRHREARYDRVEWPAYKGQTYYSWETAEWPSPWIMAKNVARYEHLRRYPRSAIEGLAYHYTSAAALQGIIESNSLWLTDYAYLNDATELVHGKKQLEEVLDHLRSQREYSHGHEVFGLWLDRLRDGPSPRVCVASFSLDGDNLSQWRAYGGIALGFDARQSFGYLPETLLDVVTYGEDEQTDRLGLFAHHHHYAYLKELEFGRGDRVDRIRTSLDEFYRVVAFFKHRSFADEREVRLAYVESPEVFEELGQRRATKRYRASGNQLIPYVATSDLALRVGGTSQQPLLPVREVIVGPHPRALRIQRGLQDFLAEKGYAHVDVRLSNVPYEPHAT